MKPRPTAAVLLQMADENARWPLVMREWPSADRPQWPNDMRNPPTRVWRSRGFMVQQFERLGQPVRLTIQRTTLRADGEWMDEITWDDLQRIKREIGYGDRFAVEAYPEDRDVVNIANLRHLWLMSETPAWAWRKLGETVPA